MDVVCARSVVGYKKDQWIDCKNIIIYTIRFFANLIDFRSTSSKIFMCMINEPIVKQLFSIMLEDIHLSLNRIQVLKLCTELFKTYTTLVYTNLYNTNIKYRASIYLLILLYLI